MSDKLTVPERITALEVRVEDVVEMNAIETEKLEEISKTVQRIEQEMSRYKGWIGGLLFAISCILAFIKTLPLLIGAFFTNKN